MHNVILLIEPSKDPWNISLKAGYLFLNRFCIEEDLAFEISGVYFLKKSDSRMARNTLNEQYYHQFNAKRKSKGFLLIDICVMYFRKNVIFEYRNLWIFRKIRYEYN